MNLADLQQRRDQAQQQFDANATQAQSLEDEQKRLQGEYRLLDELITSAEAETETAKVADPAKTVTATPKDEATNGKR